MPAQLTHLFTLVTGSLRCVVESMPVTPFLLTVSFERDGATVAIDGCTAASEEFSVETEDDARDLIACSIGVMRVDGAEWLDSEDRYRFTRLDGSEVPHGRYS